MIKHEWNGTILTITSDSGTSSADLKGVKGDTGARGIQGLRGETGGGALIADGTITKDTTWSSSRIMDNFAEKLAYTGNPVKCNPIPNYPLHIMTTIKPKQSGSGEPYPPGNWKNLITYPYLNMNGTKSGITFTTNSDGSMTLNGTSTATAYINLCNVDFGDTNNTVITNATNGNYTFSISDNEISGVSMRYQGDTDKLLFIRVNSGFTFNNVIVYPQVEMGNVYRGWEPYSNIRPVIGFDEVNVWQTNSVDTLQHIIPFNEKVYGGILDWEKGLFTVEWECIEEYNGEEITNEYYSSVGSLENGYQVVYKLKEPYVIEVDKPEIAALTGENTFTTDATEISVLGRVDTMYQLAQLTARVEALEAALSGVNE